MTWKPLAILSITRRSKGICLELSSKEGGIGISIESPKLPTKVRQWEIITRTATAFFLKDLHKCISEGIQYIHFFKFYYPAYLAVCDPSHPVFISMRKNRDAHDRKAAG